MAEAIEAIAAGGAGHANLVGMQVEQVKLPEGAVILALVRGEEVIMAHHDTVIRPDDHVIVFCTSKKLVARVEKLFQVGWGFF